MRWMDGWMDEGAAKESPWWDCAHKIAHAVQGLLQMLAARLRLLYGNGTISLVDLAGAVQTFKDLLATLPIRPTVPVYVCTRTSPNLQEPRACLTFPPFHCNSCLDFLHRAQRREGSAIVNSLRLAPVPGYPSPPTTAVPGGCSWPSAAMRFTVAAGVPAYYGLLRDH